MTNGPLRSTSRGSPPRPTPLLSMPRAGRPPRHAAPRPPGMRPFGPGGDFAPRPRIPTHRPPPPSGSNFSPRFPPPAMHHPPRHPWFGWRPPVHRPEIPGAPGIGATGIHQQIHSVLRQSSPGSTWLGGGDADGPGEWEGGS